MGRYIRPVIAAADILKEEQVLQVKGTTIQLMPKAAIEEAFRAASPFIAKYGQETFDQILAAKRAGKEIMCEFTGTPDGYDYLIGDVLTGLFPLQYFKDQDDENIHTAKFHSIVEAREGAESTNGVTGHLGITLICEPSGWSISTLFVPASVILDVPQFHYEVYDVLPARGESNVLYLIGPIGSGNDRYEEYVYADGDFVKIGDTSVNLPGHVTNQEIDALFDDGGGSGSGSDSGSADNTSHS